MSDGYLEPHKMNVAYRASVGSAEESLSFGEAVNRVVDHPHAEHQIRREGGDWTLWTSDPEFQQAVDAWLAFRDDFSVETPSGGAEESAVASIDPGIPVPAYALLLRTRSGGGLAETWVFGRSQIDLGRDASRADIQLAREPFDPAHLYPANVQASMRISSCHLRISVAHGEVSVLDLGSTNGTAINGQRLTAAAVPVTPVDRIVVADAVTLCAEGWVDAAGTSGGARVTRVDNRPELSYLLVPDGVGIWEDGPHALGPMQVTGQSASCVIRWDQGAPYLSVLSNTAAKIDGVPLPYGASVWLREHSIIHVGERWVGTVAAGRS